MWLLKTVGLRRLLTLTVDQVAERLENRFAPLTGGTAPPAPPRQRTCAR
ncbi:hypothetical protein [Streptomyces sp. NPDC058678]